MSGVGPFLSIRDVCSQDGYRGKSGLHLLGVSLTAHDGVCAGLDWHAAILKRLPAVGSGRHGAAPLLLSRIDLRQCSRLFIAYLEVQTETAREATCQRQLEKRSAVVMLLPNVDGARAWRGRRRPARRMKGWPVTMMDWWRLN
jgi:hypothetical protein